jgi:hypothetical protein
MTTSTKNDYKFLLKKKTNKTQKVPLKKRKRDIGRVLKIESCIEKTAVCASH